MSIQELKQEFGDFAKDTKINLSSVLSEEGAEGLSLTQIAGTALACAYAVKNARLASAIQAEFADSLSAEEIAGVKSAASIMAMNNIYYRFTHLTSDSEYQSMPAKLRMQVIGNPGIDKVNFEIYSLAVSALNGCGMCIDSHAKTLLKHDVSKTGIQSAVRIASVIYAADQSLAISAMPGASSDVSAAA